MSPRAVVRFWRALSGWPQPGYWVPVVLDGRPTARVGCPVCGSTALLVDHSIDADGTVRPSMVCPAGDCHYWAVLDGWP